MPNERQCACSADNEFCRLRSLVGAELVVIEGMAHEILGIPPVRDFICRARCIRTSACGLVVSCAYRLTLVAVGRGVVLQQPLFEQVLGSIKSATLKAGRPAAKKA